MNDPDLVSQWLHWLEHTRGRQPGTIDKYQRYLDRLAQSLNEKNRGGLLNASRADLEEFTGRESHDAGMRPRSRRPVIAAVRGFYAWAFKSKCLSENPAHHLEYPAFGKRLPKGMELSNAEAWLQAPDLHTFLGVRDAAIIGIFLGCGLRRSGLVKLNEGDLISVRDPDTNKERLLIRVTEKGDHQRFVPAPEEARLLIRAYLGHPELDQIDRYLPDGDQVLFVSTNCRTIPPHEYYGEARRLAPRSIDELLKKYGDAAGIPRNQCHPHALRHLYGTELAEDDTQLLKMQVLMGHSDPKSTKQYVHVAMRSLAKVVDKSNPLGKIRTPVTELARALSER